MEPQTIQILLNLATALFALLAAIFWGASASVKFPEVETLKQAKASGKPGIKMSKINDDAALTVESLNRQAKFSKYAATSAAIAALAQGVAQFSTI